MKRARLLPTVLLALLACSLRADPILDLQVAQSGTGVTLTWSILNAGSNSGAAIWLQGEYKGASEAQFIGWWEPMSFSLQGTLAGGYDGETAENDQIQQPNNSKRWDGVFTPGTHTFWADLIDPEGYRPKSVTPNGAVLPKGAHTTTLVGTYTIQPVLDSGSTAVLLAGAILLVAALRHRFGAQDRAPLSR